MELADFIHAGLDRVKEATKTTLDGLSHDELKWQPKPEANSIGLILFHMARSEDTYVQSRILGKPQIWELERWYQKLNLPLAERGSGLTAEQVAAFPVPQLSDWMGYSEAVRSRTLDCLKGMRPGEFDRIVNTPHAGNLAVGVVFARLIVHLAQHTGEISYLRGLQRGINK